MGKVPVRLKEVVYMVSPFEVSILNGLFKDFGKKCQKNISEVRTALTGRTPKAACPREAALIRIGVFRVQHSEAHNSFTNSL